MELDNTALLELARAQFDANRLKQDELNLERRRQAIPLQLIETAANLLQELRQLMLELKNNREDYRSHSEWVDNIVEDIVNRLERQEYNMTLLLRQGNSDDRLKAAQELEDESSIRAQLKKRHRNLNKLKEREAEYGGEAPISLINQIEIEENAIKELEQKLK